MIISSRLDDLLRKMKCLTMDGYPLSLSLSLSLLLFFLNAPSRTVHDTAEGDIVSDVLRAGRSADQDGVSDRWR